MPADPAPAPAAPAWVNRVWLRADSTDLPGTLRIFLADGTLVMDSCWETYRLARWEEQEAGIVTWQEDAASVEAHLAMDGAEALQVRLVAGRDTLVEQYRAARVPYLCPEMRR